MRLIFILIISFAGAQSLAAEKKSTERVPSSGQYPANVAVYSVSGSNYSAAEKWVDSVNNVVCYSGSPGGSSSFSISCVKVDSAK